MMTIQSLVGKKDVKFELQYEFGDASYIRAVCIQVDDGSIFLRPRMITIAERHEIGVIDVSLESKTEIHKKYCINMNGIITCIKKSIETKFYKNENNNVYAYRINFDNSILYILPASMPEYISIIISGKSEIMTIGNSEYDIDNYYFN